MNRLEMCYQLTDSETLYLSNCRFKLLETILCDIGEGDDIAIYTDLMESCKKSIYVYITLLYGYRTRGSHDTICIVHLVKIY